MCGDLVVITRPGAPSRRGEIASVARKLGQIFRHVDIIQPPGKLDGGDVCFLGDRFLIGLSQRTDEEGALQMARYLSSRGHLVELVDIRNVRGLLHLKSGLSYLGDNRVLVLRSTPRGYVFAGLEIVVALEDEAYAANCVRINDHVLTPDGYPATHRRLREMGYNLMKLDVSEFQKMEGGISSLSLRL